MHDIRRLRDHSQELKQNLLNKNFDADVDALLELDIKWRDQTRRADDLKAALNSASRAIGEAKKAGRDAVEEMEAARKIREEASNLDETKRELKEKIDTLLLSWPAEPDDSAPIGKDASENPIFKEATGIREFDFEIKDHLDICNDLGILDMDRGAKITGSGWPLYVGEGAALERALINYMLNTQTRVHGYKELYVPFVVNRSSALGTGQLPKLEDDMYHFDTEDFFLIPTAEVPITNIHRNEMIAKDDLPIKYSAFSACFRREAGAYGSDTRGLLRVHQFNKVELVQIVEPAESEKIHLEILDHATTILENLKIPYRVIELCTGDLSFGAAKCFDIEVWSPAHKTWLEASSVSNFKDFQSRRMNLRYREGKEKPIFPHTLNGSGLATSRLMVALIENYQTPEGRILIPEALQHYMGGIDQIYGDSK